MYSSAIAAKGKFGANVSCWKVVYELMCAAASVASSSVSTGGVEAVAGSGGGGAVSAGWTVPGKGLATGDPSFKSNADPGFDAIATPMVTLTAVSSSACAASGSWGSDACWVSRARRRAALRSALPILTSRTLTVAGSSPKTFCENTKNTSTRSSPCSWSSRDLGESGRMNVRDSPRAVRYVPAKSSTFSPFSPHKMARKL